MLSEVKRRAQSAGYHNIVLLKSDEYDFKLEDESVDFVLICTVLHEIEEKIRFMREASRVCRNGGKVSVIEFNEKETDFGPPLKHRIGREQTCKLLTDSALKNLNIADINRAFYSVAGTKQ
jgi:ubiquinone/menaquinone biosynthesis C-methylase UbiE